MGKDARHYRLSF